ncbi:MAG: hypothetical protein GY838_12990 [bacterium]|nr:hypothetical protein [bacterium]
MTKPPKEVRPSANPCYHCIDLPICPDIGDPSDCPKWAEEKRHHRLVDLWRIVMGRDPIYNHGPAILNNPELQLDEAPS